MKTLLQKAEGFNFTKVFTIFFLAFVVFGILAFTVGVADPGHLLERVTLTRFRGRMFVDAESTFRFFSYMFLLGFNVLLALWVYADGKKNNAHRALWPVLALVTGLIGWLVYMIKRVDYPN